MFASHAAVAFASAEGINNLVGVVAVEAVATRDLLGQAKGILMERYKVTPDQALRILVKVSNDNNLALARLRRTWPRPACGRGRNPHEVPKRSLWMPEPKVSR